jgi:hypothetical protein
MAAARLFLNLVESALGHAGRHGAGGTLITIIRLRATKYFLQPTRFLTKLVPEVLARQWVTAARRAESVLKKRDLLRFIVIEALLPLGRRTGKFWRGALWGDVVSRKLPSRRGPFGCPARRSRVQVGVYDSRPRGLSPWCAHWPATHPAAAGSAASCSLAICVGVGAARNVRAPASTRRAISSPERLRAKHRAAKELRRESMN